MPIVEKIKKYPLSHLYLDTRITAEKDDVSLSAFLNTNQGFILTSMQFEVMALQLIRAVKILHEMNIVHQNICLDNVRVFQNSRGEFYLKLANLSYAYESESAEEGENSNDKAQAARYFDSPEIAAIEIKTKSVKGESISFGQKLSKNIQPLPEYKKPDPSNDMWALGILLYYLFYKNYPIEEAQTEFSILLAGLLHPNKKERLTIEQALKLQEEKVKLAKAENKSKIEAFFERVTDREKENVLPEKLNKYIKQNELNTLYRIVLTKKAILTTELEQKKTCRLDKKLTGFARTLNLIFDPTTEDVLLILETKSKNEQGVKVTNHAVFKGASKKTKLAWAIDGETPQQFANSVLYITEDYSLLSAKIEVAVSERITARYGTTEVGINRASLGCRINKKGKWRGKDYLQKISFYSNWANCYSLKHFMLQKEAKLLTKDQLDAMTIQLVKALYSLHQLKIMYQDLKPKNILVFRGDFHQYRLALIDFGSAYNPLYSQTNTTALATFGYESPEIALYHKLHPDVLNHYFNDKSFFSYGRELSSQIKFNPEFEFPDPLNDAFALGILLDELYNQRAFTKSSVKTLSPIMGALLLPNKKHRLSIEQLYFQLCSGPQKVPVLTKPTRAEEKGSKDLDKQLAMLTLKPTFVPSFKHSTTTPKNKPVELPTIQAGLENFKLRVRLNSLGTA